MYRAEFSKIIKEDIDNAHNYIKETLEAPMAVLPIAKDGKSGNFVFMVVIIGSTVLAAVVVIFLVVRKGRKR